MDETPTALFESYELDFRHIIESVKEKLDAAGSGEQFGEQRKAALRKVEVELDDADDIVSALEIEIQGIPTSIKPAYLTRLKQSKADLTRYKKLAKDIHARAALLARSPHTSDDPYGDTERTDRERLLVGTQKLDEGKRRLKDTQRIALEAEDVGVDILRSLRAQRETLENTSNTLQRADTNIERASGTIRKMVRQMYKQRFMLSAIGVFLILLVIVILYFKIVR
ncbi:Vesicle transport v-SNARE 13 [Hypsizygus marmoreus]|uniref:Vesicle transport v-SNARE 13 n=1 Tax=Hypsizygus marmoreus TaxID=39966 RepID=A0A369K5Z5_HYPMA|nr:Vesicle transport v-SNARE 13 [Hypsizygus marmoreus]